jgi:hypothetical protein
MGLGARFRAAYRRRGKRDDRRSEEAWSGILLRVDAVEVGQTYKGLDCSGRLAARVGVEGEMILSADAHHGK